MQQKTFWYTTNISSHSTTVFAVCLQGFNDITIVLNFTRPSHKLVEQLSLALTKIPEQLVLLASQYSIILGSIASVLSKLTLNYLECGAFKMGSIFVCGYDFISLSLTDSALNYNISLMLSLDRSPLWNADSLFALLSFQKTR